MPRLDLLLGNTELRFFITLITTLVILRRAVVPVWRRARIFDENILRAFGMTSLLVPSELRGGEIILLASVIPLTMLTFFFGVGIYGNIPVGSELGTVLRTSIGNPALVMLFIVLTIYFLNGRLSKALRPLFLFIQKRFSWTRT